MADWCSEMGAVSLEEVRECWMELAEEISGLSQAVLDQNQGFELLK